MIRWRRVRNDRIDNGSHLVPNLFVASKQLITRGESAMTKRELVVRISKETGLVQQDVFTVIQKTLDYIVESLAKGQTVEFRNFGVFEVRIRKQRIGRNPNKPANVVTIPSRKVVKFKMGRIMKARVMKNV
jgi:nucleoid DNA-binding protein